MFKTKYIITIDISTITYYLKIPTEVRHNMYNTTKTIDEED